jgi:putative endonuclease
VNKYQTGLQGQKTAEEYLLSNGYLILERNYRIRSGEIDIIAQEKSSGYIVFAEVKYRGSVSFGFPCEAVGKTKQKKIINTAMHYIQKRQKSCDFRFDVIEVLGESVNHIENAFQSGRF